MINFDINSQVEPFTFVLSRPDHHHYGELTNITDRQLNIMMNAPDEISFTIHKYADGFEEPLFDKIIDLIYVYVPEIQEYFILETNTVDGSGNVILCSGVGAGEAELAQSLIYSLEINTDIDIERPEYKSPTVFYDKDHPENSLLNRTLDKLPNWSIDYVDTSLLHIQRTFSANNTDVYTFLTTMVAEEIGCLFKFDSVNRTISAYDLKTVCRSCGHRGTFEHKCPKCNSTDLQEYGNDTGIYIDTENLAEELTLVTNTDAIKNCFRMEAGDDDMTSAIINRNPNGSAYMYYFSDDNKRLMPPDLVNKLEDYEKLVASFDSEYKEISQDIYECYDKILYYTSGMMPSPDFPPTTAKEQAKFLTGSNLSPLGMPKITSTTSTATVNNAVKSWAKAFIRSGWYKAEIKSGEFVYNGLDPDGAKVGTWTGSFTVTSYSDEEDTCDTDTISIKVWDSYHTYLDQRLSMYLKEKDMNEDGSVFDVLKIPSLIEYRSAIARYGLHRLMSFADSLQGCLDIMIESGASDEVHELYDEIYVPYFDKLIATNEEIDKRSGTIKEYESKLNADLKRQNEIHEILNFRKYLGEELYSIFCVYKREQVYSNSNYISADLDNKTIFENAEKFIEVTKEELFKSGNYQRSISGNIIDFLAMEEFKPLVDHFDLGNWIYARVMDSVYRLRLIKISFNFDNLADLGLEFSDVTKTINGADDLMSILNQANSIAGSYNAVMNQVKDSKEQTDLMKEFVNKGLDTTTIKIVNTADNQNISIDEHGLLARYYDYFTESYSPEQIKLINNGLYFTDNGWKSSKAGVGHFIYYDPVTGEEKDGYGVIADQIIGNIILGKEVGIYNKNGSVTLDENGFTISADCLDGENKNCFKIEKKYKDEDDTEKTKELLYLNSDGELIFNGSSVKFEVSSDKKEIIDLPDYVTSIVDTKTKQVKSTQILYYASDSNEIQVNGSWVKTAPTSNDKYIWQKLVTEYSDGSSYESDPICIVSKLVKDGKDGINGTNGADGRSIKSIITEYYLSDSKYAQTGGEWTTNSPEWEMNKYLWIRTLINYENPESTEYCEPWCDSSWEVVNNIEIGGKNLLNNTAFNNDFEYWIMDKSGVVDNLLGDYNGYSSLMVGSEELYQFRLGQNVLAKIEPNTEYTFSFYCFHEIGYPVGTTSNAPQINVQTVTNNIKNIGFGIPHSGVWEKFVFHFSTDDYDLSNLSRFEISINYYSDGCRLYFRNFQLEKGMFATDYSPSVDDTDEKINNRFDQVIETTTQMISDTEARFNIDIDDIKATVQENFTANEELISTKTSEIEQKVDSYTISFDSQISNLEKVNSDMQSQLDQYSTYFKFNKDGLEIGKQESKFTMNLSNEKLSFLNSGVEMAYFSNQTLNVDNVDVKKNLFIGNFAWIVRPNGSVSLKKVREF